MSCTALLAGPPLQAASDWGQALFSGAPGIMLLHIEYARCGRDRWDHVHRWAATMTRAAIDTHPDVSGLYRGAPAVAFALRCAGQPQYAAALQTLDRHVTALTRLRLACAHERMDGGQPPALREFDLISGLTGLGVCLLQHDAESLLPEVLSYLVRLTETRRLDGDTVPGWWTVHGPEGRPSHAWPGGHGNLGLAHGIAGPLALLAIAYRRGVEVPGHLAAIKRICAFLDEWRRGTESGPWWPGLISRAEYHDGAVHQPGPQRPSWCYGTPGLARAQQLAAMALGDSARQARAEAALVACVCDSGQLAQIADPSLCHGWAGVLLTTWRAARDAEHCNLGTHLPGLRAHLEAHVERHCDSIQPGLLQGLAGLELTRLALDDLANDATRWDTCLLIHG